MEGAAKSAGTDAAGAIVGAARGAVAAAAGAVQGAVKGALAAAAPAARAGVAVAFFAAGCGCSRLRGWAAGGRAGSRGFGSRGWLR